ncbi:MAG: mechanosensitive ion channel family protein [Polyangiales bacterium]
MTLLDQSWAGNTLRTWLLALGALVLTRVVLGLMRAFLERRAGRLASLTRTRLDDLAVTVLGHTRSWFLWAVSLQVAALMLQLDARWQRGAHVVIVFAFVVQAALWGGALITEVSQHYVDGDPEDEESIATEGARRTAAGTAGFVARMVLWAGLLLLLLDNLGVNISALIAGLGIGGVAVALALQNILGDVFASVTIAIDKPFVVGDFIVVGDFLGTVESVGLKTTRLKSLHGEQLVFANADLLKSRLKNYKHLAERRIVFGFGVTYQTTADDLEKIPGLVMSIVEARDGLRFDRAHFKSFGASSLDFEVVYYVSDPDYAFYMDRQQAINLALVRAFAERGIEFAYPTQTLFVQRQPEAQPRRRFDGEAMA